MYYLRLVFFFASCLLPKVHFVSGTFSIMPNILSEDPSQFAGKKTIGDLVEIGRHYRHPDSARISYPDVVQEPLGTINKPEDRPLKIAVVGGGVAGIAAIYELSRLANASQNLNVTLFESDHEHFTEDYLRPFISLDTYKRRAGRVFAAESFGEDSTKHTVYEIGAMRFPEIAGLTWHYASQVFNVTEEVDPFPNPGTVPTEFVQGERVDRYIRQDWLDENSPTKNVSNLVKLGIVGDGNATSKNVSLFLIGGKDPAKISQELKSKNTTEGRLEQILNEWKTFAKQYDGLSLESAVRRVISDKHHELYDVPGLHSNESKINYYVELFGRFGFGTGGFKPLFSTSLTEMMRLLLWDYSNEYSLPVKENVEFVKKLFEKATITNGLNVHVERARVSDVFHLDEDNGTSAAVLFYRINAIPLIKPLCSEKFKVEESKKSSLDRFDYVILAVTPKQANSIVSRAGFQNVARKVRMGDYQAQYEHLLKVRPPFILNSSPSADAANSQIFSAINQIHMVTSSKIFATIKKLKYDTNAPKLNDTTITAIVSDCGLSASYIVPSPHQNDTFDPQNRYYSFLISYNWEDDTKTLQNELLEYPKNVECGNTKNQDMIKRVINRTIRDVVNPAANTTDGKPQYERWWFGHVLSDAHGKGELTDVLSYDWTTHHSSGAFKLDVTGDYYNTHLLVRYHTHAIQAKNLQNRFFLAGDSYSHLGGWIEGAFMSSVNAVSGLIVAANQGDVSKLNCEARKVMNYFDPVA